MTLQPPPVGDAERDFRALVEGAEDAIVVLDVDDRIVFANRAARILAGYPPDAEPDLNLADVLPPAEVVRVLALRSARRAGEPVPRRYESILRRLDGTQVPIEVSVSIIFWTGSPAHLVIFRDLTERKQAEAELAHREAVLRGVAVAADCLVRSGSWQESIDQMIAFVGQAVRVHRVYFWQIESTPDGEMRTVNRHLWVDRGYERGPEPATLEGFPLRATGYGSWLDPLLKGQPLSSRVSEFPEQVRANYGALGVKTVFSTPIMVDGALWGVLGLADCEREREWLPYEVDALLVLSSIISALIRRERIREALRESREMFHATFEQAPAGIFIADSGGTFLDVNRSACEMLGYSREELLGRQIRDVHPSHAAHRAMGLFEGLHDGDPRPVERLMRTKAGNSIHVEIIPKRLADGRLQAIVTDITARKTAEEALRRHDAVMGALSYAAEKFLTSRGWSEWIEDLLERLGRATEASRVHLYKNSKGESGEILVTRRHAWIDPSAPQNPTYDAQVTYPLQASGFGHMMGRAEHEVITMRRSTVTPEIRATFDALGVRSLLTVPIRTEEEWWGILGLTDCLAERDWSGPEVDALRAAANIVGAMITRLGIEAALTESEEKYRSLIEGANQSIVQIGYDGVFRFASATSAARLGYSQSEVVGKTMWELFPRENADRQVSLLRQAIDERKLLVVEMPTVVQEKPIWHETRIQPLADPGGAYTSAIVIITDITERKQAEEKILRYQRRLRSLSSELALIELRERRRIAADLHDRIGQALAIAKMRLGTLREASGDHLSPALDEIRGLLDQTIQDTRTLTFDLSPPVLHDLGFEPAVEWLIERFRGQHGIAAFFQDDGETKSLAPETRIFLFQSVQELLMNVAKHAHARRVEVLSRRDGTTIQVIVADDGTGFDPVQAAIAEPRHGGFGLFSIRERLTSIGGWVDLESSPGRGTRVVLTAPLNIETASGGSAS